MTLLSNPRLAIFGIVLLALLAAGISVFFLLGPFYGIAATAVAVFTDWQLGKLLRRQMRTTVAVDDDGVHFNLYGDDRIDFTWPGVTFLGLAVTQDKRGRRSRQLFFYQEDGDKLMVVPTAFARFEDLVAETRRLAPGFRDIALATGETLKEHLRSLLTPSAGTPELN